MVSNGGTERRIACGGLFMAIGHSPNVKFLEGSNVKLSENGYLDVKNNILTSVDGVFAAGDVRISVVLDGSIIDCTGARFSFSTSGDCIRLWLHGCNRVRTLAERAKVTGEKEKDVVIEFFFHEETQCKTQALDFLSLVESNFGEGGGHVHKTAVRTDQHLVQPAVLHKRQRRAHSRRASALSVRPQQRAKHSTSPLQNQEEEEERRKKEEERRKNERRKKTDTQKARNTQQQRTLWASSARSVPL